MRRIFASLLDALLAAGLGFLGFQIGQIFASCSDRAHCFAAVPLSIGGALLLLVAYFLAGYRIWGRTPGERLFDPPTRDTAPH